MDTRTVFIACFAEALLIGALAVYFASRQRGTRAIATWGYSILLLAAGIAGIALRGRIPSWVSITLANMLILAAFVLGHRALRIFRGEQGPDPLGWAAVAVSGVLLLAFSELWPNLGIRVAIVSLVTAGLLSRTALMLGREPIETEMRPSMSFMQGVYWLASAVMLARGAVGLMRPGEDLLAPGAQQASWSLVLLMLLTAASFGFFWMELQRRNGELARLASRDMLTGVLNRRAFEEEFQREMVRARRDATPFCLVLMDLDRFKSINDRYGHLAGDAALRAVATLIEKRIRKPDRLARYGGEEFALLMPGTSKAAALTALERIRTALAEATLDVQGHAIALTLSAGVAQFDGDGAHWDALVGAADRALYAAKDAGRDRIVAAGSPPAPGLSEHESRAVR